MGVVEPVPIAPLPTQRFEDILEPGHYRSFLHAIEIAQELFRDRIVYNVNSTARGGGVAEMLRSLIAYARGAGVDARWLVITGSPDFFRITKRIHNRLHGSGGDGGTLGGAERKIYDDALRANAEELAELVTERDVVLLHDPQTAGLIPQLRDTGALLIWRCHVGIDMPNDVARDTWRFLIPYVSEAAVTIFSRPDFKWEGLDADSAVIPPSIDAFSPKNQDLDDDTVNSILAITGLIDAPPPGTPAFVRIDGTQAQVERAAAYHDGSKPPPRDVPLVVQVSRWDRLKDPIGVIHGFERQVAPVSDAHLIVAGPSVAAVADDPEGAEVLAEARAAWEALPEGIRGRVHLATLPMDDDEENSAIVNALQRRADVVVQKSIAEGFGLTVAEAMWKGRPVVASRIGGIQDQIVNGETGVLISDPLDLEEFGGAVVDLLAKPDKAERIGSAARERVRDAFLGPRHLMQYVELIGKLLTGQGSGSGAVP